MSRLGRDLRPPACPRAVPALGVPVADTLSCYDPVAGSGRPVHCGRCDACLLRRKGFAEARVADPTTYAG